MKTYSTFYGRLKPHPGFVRLESLIYGPLETYSTLELAAKDGQMIGAVGRPVVDVLARGWC